MASAGVLAFPSRFYLRADDIGKLISRAPQPDPHDNNYSILVMGEMHDEEAVFELVSEHPNAARYPSAYTLRHVETQQMAVQHATMRIMPIPPIDTYYQPLIAAGSENSTVTVLATSLRRPMVDDVWLPPDAMLVRTTWQETEGVSSLWPPPPGLPPINDRVPTVFTVIAHESPRTREWQQVVFDMSKAVMEDVEPFSKSVFRFDNSTSDQATTIRRRIAFTESVASSWTRSLSVGFRQSISVTARIPFVGRTDIGFTAEQTFDTAEGGGFARTVDDFMEVVFTVPPFRKAEVFVTGVSGRVTIPFRFVQIARFNDGAVRERALDDGVCANVSSVSMGWAVDYFDSNDRGIDVVAAGEIDVLPSGKLPLLF